MKNDTIVILHEQVSLTFDLLNEKVKIGVIRLWI